MQVTFDNQELEAQLLESARIHVRFFSEAPIPEGEAPIPEVYLEDIKLRIVFNADRWPGEHPDDQRRISTVTLFGGIEKTFIVRPGDGFSPMYFLQEVYPRGLPRRHQASHRLQR